MLVWVAPGCRAKSGVPAHVGVPRWEAHPRRNRRAAPGQLDLLDAVALASPLRGTMPVGVGHFRSRAPPRPVRKLRRPARAWRGEAQASGGNAVAESGRPRHSASCAEGGIPGLLGK
eukprot:12630906-Alexandrium_andersonii.AAC.1